MYTAKIALITLVIGGALVLVCGPALGLAGAIVCCLLMFGWLSLGKKP